VVPEADLKQTEHGLEPSGEGWFVVNARDAKWLDGHFGAYTRFEGDPRFTRLGFNIGVLAPGQAACYYHGEGEQEDFLVLQGECVLLIEREERALRQWDFVHCPDWTEHVFVGAGDGPCVVLMVGARPDTEVVYPVADVALRHGAGVERETPSPDEAYAPFPDSVRARPDGLDLPWNPA
jgi:uncharacterized cupin superfamily protein